MGPFNTGTVLMSSFVRRLYTNDQNRHFQYWKHSVPPRFLQNSDEKTPMDGSTRAFPGVLFLCMIRSPYFWLTATCRRQYNVQFHVKFFDLSERLRSPVYLKGELFNNIVQLWNSYYRRYALYLEEHNSVTYVRLEDLVRNPSETLRLLDSKLERKPGSDEQACIAFISRAPSKADNAYGEIWEEKNRLEFALKAIRADDLSFINQQLDPLLMKKFAYSYAWPSPQIA